MQQRMHGVMPKGAEATFAAGVMQAALCAMLLCCAGCHGHKNVLEGGFYLSENGGAPMLVPAKGQSADAGNFQTTEVVLPGGSDGVKQKANEQCAIRGEVFSLHAPAPADARHWIVRSPSVSGWIPLANETNMEAQWKVFTRGLMRMQEEGCFPVGLTTFEIRTAIAEQIPLPAGDVPMLFYSDQEMGYIDLAPGMEVRLQQFLPVSKPVSTGPNDISEPGTLPYEAAYYEVTAGQGKGVRLKLARKEQRGAKGGAESEGNGLFSLTEKFSHTPVMRLFLEGIYGKGRVSNGILLGASDQRQLDALTDLIFQSDPAKCVRYQRAVCAEFPPGAPSLYFTVSVNGHAKSYLMGNTLEMVLRPLSEPEKKAALESMRVYRRLNREQYAAIHFVHTEAGASEVLLMPGDRVEWKH